MYNDAPSHDALATPAHALATPAHALATPAHALATPAHALATPAHALATPSHAPACHYLPVAQWSNEHILEWLRGVCHENNIDSGNLGGFTDCTGHQLCSMNVHQFKELHPLHGPLFYKKLREYIDNQQGQQADPYHQHHHRLPHQPHHPHHHQPSSPPPHLLQPTMNGAYHEPMPSYPVGPHSYPHWQGTSPQYPDTDTFYHRDAAPPPPTDYVGPEHPHGGYHASYQIKCEFDPVPLSPSAGLTPMPPHGYMPCHPGSHVAAPSPPTPPTAASPLLLPPDTRRDRGPKLWEFLLDLLEDPTSNPSIIRWENQEERTFRLTSPHEVSFRWGQRRPNQNTLPYDYFARALRYHYKTGMLISVPERKLVYKFGNAVFQQRRRGPNTPLPYNPDSPSPADTATGHLP